MILTVKKKAKKNPSQSQFIYHKSRMFWPGIQHGSLWWKADN